MRSEASNKIQIHYHWLSTITFLMGYLWLISAINKILNKNFIPYFKDFLQTGFLSESAYSWYVNWVHAVLIPNASVVAYIVEWGELTLGFLFITGTIWHIISDLRAAHYLIAIASLGSFILILNILFSQGAIVPFINPDEAFDAAFNMDTLVLLISGMLFVGNAWELVTEKIQREKLQKK